MKTARISKQHCVILVLLVALGIFFRTFHSSRAMYFLNDQGLLLLTTIDVLTKGIVPHVGPQISIPGAYLPPNMYFLVALFMAAGKDPAIISLAYVAINILAGVMLAGVGWLLFDASVGLWTAFYVMTSASMIENGRSIWQAHPTFFFVTAYLFITELAIRNKSTPLYCLGVFVYIFSITMYPTPLIILPLVMARTVKQTGQLLGQKSMRATPSLLVAGFCVALLLPWVMAEILVGQSTWTGASRVFAGASFMHVPQHIYIMGSTLAHDIFQIWTVVPAWLIGGVWMKYAAAALLILGALFVSKKQWRYMKKIALDGQYAWIIVGLLLLSLTGVKTPAYRLLPLYPFIFVLLAAWTRAWLANASLARRSTVGMVLTVFIVGNVSTWYRSTIMLPRDDLPKARHIARVITKDASTRREIAIGVHYYTPIDTNDYFAPPLYYLLRLSMGYKTRLTNLGNDIDRSVYNQPKLVYLVCDGFQQTFITSQCIEPFLFRSGGYGMENVQGLAPYLFVVTLIHQP